MDLNWHVGRFVGAGMVIIGVIFIWLQELLVTILHVGYVLVIAGACVFLLSWKRVRLFFWAHKWTYGVALIVLVLAGLLMINFLKEVFDYVRSLLFGIFIVLLVITAIILVYFNNRDAGQLLPM